MGRAIIKQTNEEGEIFNKWLESRLIRQNKNVLSAELGSTGSGKSYRDLRKAELWYKYHFNEPFPVDNICFGVADVMQKLTRENLRRGEIFVVEEAGVNLGSRDWQQKFSKMFNYILQSFRSMNIALFFNLPYLSMLDSQARHLLHYYAESVGIDHDKKLNKCKPFFLQVAQGTGKIYRKYPKVKYKGRTIKIKRFNYAMPSQYIIDAYELQKENYLKQLIKGFADKATGKVPDRRPNDLAFKCYDMHLTKGLPQSEVAEQIGKSQPLVAKYVKEVRKWLESNDNKEKQRAVVSISINNPLKTAPNITL